MHHQAASLEQGLHISQAASIPPIVATVGLHGSASTWVFNVVRELIADAVGEERVLTLYADRVDQLPDEATRAGRWLIIKSHQGSSELDAWLAASSALIILSVRDPRDAAMSTALRFGTPLDVAVRGLINDCNRVVQLRSQGHLLLRYEDRFFDDPVVLERLAMVLGVRPDRTMLDAISTRYRTHAVRMFAEGIAPVDVELAKEALPALSH